VKHKKKLVALGVIVAAPLLGHVAIDRSARLDPPAIDVPRVTMEESGGVRRAGKGWSVVRGVRVVSLSGTPEEIGAEHTALLRDRMEADEAVLWDGFRDVVSFGPARTVLFDLGRFRYRHVDAGFPEARRRELAAEAASFTPDPYADHMATYPRMVFLHALYDIALGFEHSPLLGCTAFGLGPDATADGHALFARAFDFEAADVFDRDKVVFVVREDGKIPFASVAWPGLVGVMTGMNAEGVAVAVHGGRAREPAESGMPVIFSLREALTEAHDADEAVRVLERQSVMVSHIVFVGDAAGRYRVVERAPGVSAFVREAKTITNHFEGPLAADPKNETVRSTTTTLSRRARIDELVRETPPHGGSVERATAMLRDHRCAGGEACPLGDRRAIDAFIATHGVVFDMTTRALWVTEGPHLSGRFVKIDLAAIVATGGIDPASELETLPEDPALGDGRYAVGRARAGGPMLKESHK
jgi:hypothetical protein